jgi:hypothetical protein
MAREAVVVFHRQHPRAGALPRRCIVFLATRAIQRAAGMTLLLRPPVCTAASNDDVCGALFLVTAVWPCLS